MKRITSSRVKKWGIGIGATGVPLAVLMIWFLVSLGSIEVINYSGDIVCEGTESDPCIALINISVKEDIFIYPSNNWRSTPFYTDVPPKSVKMYRSWGNGWREINLSKPCNGAWCGCHWCTKTKLAKFSYVFREGKKYQLKYEVIKNNPEDIIKWGFGPIDPVFNGYNSKERKVIFNGATIQLNTKQLHRVIRGKDRLVAEMTLASTEPVDKLIDLMDFYDINKDLKQFDKEYVLKIKEFYDVKVIDYETICKEKEVISKNGTYIKKYDCYQKKIGSHIEKRFKWKEYKNDILPKGETTIGIFADVLPNEKVEWIPTIFGAKNELWAGWVESFDVGIFAYYNFSSSIEQVSGYDLHDVGTPVFTGESNTTCLIGGCGFSTGDNKWNVSDNDQIDFVDNDYQFTLNMWMRPLDINEKYYSGKMATYTTVLNAGGTITTYSPGVTTSTSVAGITTDRWMMMTFTRNTTNFCVWINGTLPACVQNKTVGANNDHLSLGGNYDATTYHGYFDEVGMWNRSLSPSEISDLWNSGDGISRDFPALSDVDYSVALPIGIIRFLNCSTDYENKDCRPDGQTNTIASINVTNNGTVTGDFSINLTGALNANWTIVASNDSFVNNITLSTTAQTIWSDVAVNETKKIWLSANCSYVSSNPGQSITMWVV